MRHNHKFFSIFCILLSCLIALAACGGKEKDAQPSPSGTEGQPSLSGGDNTEVEVDEEAFYDVASELKKGRFLGMQYWQGEPVQLWMSEPTAEDGQAVVSVYMYYRDGTREVCIERISESAARMIYIRDAEGCCYTVSGDGDNKKVARLDSTGKAQYTVQLKGSLRDLCALADGRLALLTYGGSTSGGYDLFLLDTKGNLTAVFQAESMLSPVLGASEKEILLLEGDYVYRVNLKDGKKEQIYSFRQTAYDMKKDLAVVSDIQDFHMGTDGSFGILRAGRHGSGKCETVKLVAVNESRKDVVLRTTYIIEQETWLKERILEFNDSQEEYRVVIDAYENGGDLDDFVMSTGVELATGKGPEILMGSVLADSVSGLIEKGILMDLAPLMEQSGIREEDYFPVTFDLWRTGDSVYCLFYNLWVKEQLMSTAVLGDMREPSIEMLADAMLAYPENAAYGGSWYSADNILQELLEGSETLWGMVDLEKGTCDFGGELFGKLLEAAKRYQYDERNNFPKVTTDKYLSTIHTIYYNFRTRAEEETRGFASAGTLFDDGSHPVPAIAQSRYKSLMLNANAANRDGAWEFVKFILSDEAQEKLAEKAELPVKKSVFKAQMEREIEDGLSKDVSVKVFDGPLTKERADEIEEFLENARALPYKTEPILAIIWEEAKEYFNGNKSKEQVAEIIENRVQLYLDEQRKK